MGWSGLGHKIRLADGIEFGMEVFGCDDRCEECRFSGPVRTPKAGIVHQRCVGATENTCSSDEDCGSNGKCRYYLGPNFDLKITDDLALCSLAFFEPLENAIPNGERLDSAPVQGIMNLKSGKSTVTSMNMRIYSALICGECGNDPTVGDGLLGGTCSTLTRFGQPCDVVATSPTGKRVSYECPPVGDPALGIAVQMAPLSTDSIVWTLTSDSPKCAGESGSRCWCGICDDPPDRMCRRDADCIGTCQPAPRTKPDACVQGIPYANAACSITDQERNIGSCTAQISDSIFTTPAGCFGGDGVLDTKIAAVGDYQAFDENGVATATLAGLACMPQSASAQIGDALGLPGPASVEIPMTVTILDEN